jgi:hypothetical protein
MTTPENVDDIIAHYGKKGMKWGVRSNRVGDAVVSRGFGITTTGSRERSAERSAKKKVPQPVTVSDKKKKIKTSGGKGHPAHPDAVRARTLGQVGKKSGLKSLSNQDLQAYAHRLQLEQNVSRLNYNEKSAPSRFVSTLLGRQGSALARETSKTAGAKAGKAALNKATRRSIRVARVAATVSAV